MCVSLQRDLFALGARLADPSHKIAKRVEKIVIDDASVTRLEGWIDRLDTEIPPLRHFILSDGAPAGAALHLARTVCRRAERVGAVARQGRCRAGRDRLPQSAVRSAVHDGARRQSSRRRHRDAVVGLQLNGIPRVCRRRTRIARRSRNRITKTFRSRRA